MNLSQKQKEIVETTADKVIVVAAAAAGKTHTLIERIRYLIDSGVEPKSIVVITFTNYAANEILERLGNPGCFIGTIHSYANFLLTSKGYDTKNYIEKEQFDKFFELVKKHKDCIRPVEHLLLDEAQDSNSQQFEFLLDMVKPKNYMLIGDWRQSIYRWNGANPDYILMLRDFYDVTTYELNENYRNGKKILDFARAIIRLNGEDYYDTSVAMSDYDGIIDSCEYSFPYIAKMIKTGNNYNNWFVLCRTNSEVEKIMTYLKSEKIPCDGFKKSQFSNNEIREKMLADTVKVLTIHSAKGLEADNVIVIGANIRSEEEKCISYVAATRAKKYLLWVKPQKKSKRKVEMW